MPSPSDKKLTQPPGKAVPYVLESGAGDAHLLVGQVGRVLAGTKETGGKLAVLTLVGPAGHPIPLHFHEHEHEVFLCTRGKMKLWAGDQCRVLSPGDFGSVPAGTIHSYQLVANHSSFMGPITPAGWERFFAFNGSPYKGPGYPPVDPSPPPFEKFKRSEAEFRMHFRPDLKYAEPGAGDDNGLPGQRTAYFIQAGLGERFLAFGQISTVLSTGEESNGELGMAIIEGPKGASVPPHRHAKTAETIFCLDGILHLTLDGTGFDLFPGDFANIPAGCVHSYTMQANVTRFCSMNGPAGIEALFERAGVEWEPTIFPAEELPVIDSDALASRLAGIDVWFV